MAISKVGVIKGRFYQLVGSLSIEEVMSNVGLIEKIQAISKLLADLTREPPCVGGDR